MITHVSRRMALYAGLGLSTQLAGCWGNRSETPPIHLNQNMDFQEKGESQERNQFFADGRAMRTPPDGTVAVGFLKDDDHLYRGLDSKGQVVDALPKGMLLNAQLLDRGEERFNIYCSPCHGVTGRGDGAATRHGGGMQVEPANFHDSVFQPAPLGYFFYVQSIGVGKMRSYAAQIPERDRWAIAAWLRVLQISHRAKKTDVSPASLTKTARAK